jgi:periplasmic divalent cation tolerance protein
MNAIVLITTPTHEAAKNLTQRLLKAKLAACVNLLPVASQFWWKNKIEKTEETLMIVKTQPRLIKKIVKLVEEHHPYEVPEIIALPIIQGNPKYLAWIAETLKPSGKKNG